jgi:3-hydroxy-9,10-secoandrosta-1,3,5(10)-triene-9,17-dione monooxygenase reductase component
MTSTSDGATVSDADLLTIAPENFRFVLGHFLTGVTVISAAREGEPFGMTIGSFFSVSLNPPLVGFCAAKSSDTWPTIKRVGRFCVNVLGAEQEALSRRFATTGTDKFADVAWSLTDGGAPKLDEVLAWIDCDLEAVHDAGDHEICVGLVRGLAIERSQAPLPFYRGKHLIA